MSCLIRTKNFEKKQIIEQSNSRQPATRKQTDYWKKIRTTEAVHNQMYGYNANV